MKILRVFAAALGVFCAACSTHPVTPAADGGPAQAAASVPHYSAQERGSLYGCSALTDSAMIIAEMKQKGAPIQDVKAVFADRPNAQLTLATVDRVYDDKVGNVWDYAVTFFGDCATRVSRVPRDRSGPAGFCMLNSMIAANAQASKMAGVPIEKVDQYFSRFPGELPKSIIAGVYARSQTRAEAHAEAWNACMAPISGG
ncbi:MAG: hypothetical protein JWR07_2846 [Nevskia sp.]|nr:hypothetical protein [Nevskia sp.]